MLGLLFVQLVVDGLGLLELLGGGLIVVLDVHLERLYQIANNQIHALFNYLVLNLHGLFHSFDSAAHSMGDGAHLLRVLIRRTVVSLLVFLVQPKVIMVK